MSFGSQSIRYEPMPGAGTSQTVPSVRPIGPFLGSAGGVSSRHSRNGDGPIMVIGSLALRSRAYAVLSMTVISVPRGIRAFEPCLGGTSDNARAFQKFNDDGSPDLSRFAWKANQRRNRLTDLVVSMVTRDLLTFVWVPARKPEKVERALRSHTVVSRKHRCC